MTTPIEKRYDFILFFDVRDGNPNGDPDAGNLPRLDPETGHGLVTDVCLKRKVRNFVSMVKNETAPYRIYVKEKAVLGRFHVEAYKNAKINLGEESRLGIPGELVSELEELDDLPEGVKIEVGEEAKQLYLPADLDKKLADDWLKDTKIPKKLKEFLKETFKKSKARKPTGEDVEKGRRQMCKDFFDIRTFGAVLSLKSAPNCGQVRGPVQMTFARSVDQVVPLEHSITRMAVATEAEAEKQGGDNRTMGRKHTISYGLYRCHGFISAHMANHPQSGTGFSGEDLALFWEALKNMFDHDRSAARGEMSSRKLIVFEHESPLGNAPAHALFDRVKVTRKDSTAPARAFTDYEVTIDESYLPAGIKIDEKIKKKG